jgi:hypothetical protein
VLTTTTFVCRMATPPIIRTALDLLKCAAVWSSKSSPTFRSNVLPPSARSKGTLKEAGCKICILDLQFSPNNRGSKILRNVGELPLNYTVPHPIKYPVTCTVLLDVVTTWLREKWDSQLHESKHEG